MFRVELKEGTKVFLSDGREIGKVSRFVLDPSTNELTHVVIQGNGFFSDERVVPFEMVRITTEDRITLGDDIGDLDELPPFEETHFVKIGNEEGLNATRQTGDYPSHAMVAPAYYWYPPQGYLGFPAYGLGYHTWPRMETERNIPANTVPIQEKTNVISSDGKHVGDVERLFLEPNSDKVTHVLISKGLFFKDHKLVPAGWIKSADEEVHLVVPSDVLERLPSYEP
jgi:sporulation protein YlmC with PRC-barrel domain